MLIRSLFCVKDTRLSFSYNVDTRVKSQINFREWPGHWEMCQVVASWPMIWSCLFIPKGLRGTCLSCSLVSQSNRFKQKCVKWSFVVVILKDAWQDTDKLTNWDGQWANDAILKWMKIVSYNGYLDLSLSLMLGKDKKLEKKNSHQLLGVLSNIQ